MEKYSWTFPVFSTRVASRVAKRLKTEDFRKLKNFHGISEMFGIDGNILSQYLQLRYRNVKNQL